jgi:hypothetical protein
MGTQPGESWGYSPTALDVWAERARCWAEGDSPKDLETLAPARGGRLDRDVYLYIISGHKVANPAAAQALIGRIGPGGAN